jgi:Transposase IS116/IS110/IS902 family
VSTEPGQAHLGLNPRVRQSGGQPAQHGRITKQGQARARGMLVEAAWVAAKIPGPLRAFYERVRARRGMQVAVVATARKLTTLCWHLVVGEQDYAFQRPSLTDKKLRALQLRAGLPPRRGQKGTAAAHSRKEVRRRERALAEQAETAYRQLAAGWQPKQPAKQPPGRGVAATTGARRLGPRGAKLRGRAPSPKALLFAPGSTTPNAEPNGARSGGQRRQALKLSSVERSVRARVGGTPSRSTVHGEGLGWPSRRLAAAPWWVLSSSRANRRSWASASRVAAW